MPPSKGAHSLIHFSVVERHVRRLEVASQVEIERIIQTYFIILIRPGTLRTLGPARSIWRRGSVNAHQVQRIGARCRLVLVSIMIFASAAPPQTWGATSRTWSRVPRRRCTTACACAASSSRPPGWSLTRDIGNKDLNAYRRTTHLSDKLTSC